MGNVKTLLAVVTLIVALWFVLVSLAQAEPNDPVTEKWAKNNPGAQTPQTVEVTDDDSPIKGVVVEIPPGALSSDCTITVGVVTNAPALPDNVKAIGSVLDFGPSGTTFATPVSIMIPYTQEDLDNAGVTDPAELEVYTYDVSTLSWEEISVHHVDTINNVLVCLADHLSMYTTGKSVAAEDGGGGGGTCFIGTVATSLWW